MSRVTQLLNNIVWTGHSRLDRAVIAAQVPRYAACFFTMHDDSDGYLLPKEQSRYITYL